MLSLQENKYELPPHKLSDNKADMTADCGQEAVILAHDTETLNERCTVVLYTHAAFKIMAYHGIDITRMPSLTLTFSHHSYAPINIS